MSKIKVDNITNRSDNAPVELTEGATIPSGKKISVTTGGMVVNGTFTGTFSGDGSAITNTINISRAYAIKFILDPGNQIPYRS